ncbi:helix-turn-helix transcriptional regulator [Lentibacillus cibarius]|uniref:helix-turn-helix transcriptional regulator n=1 Tax=Lentibacillus cibarius TaxID=2583219 RepID=UPI0018F8CB77|nr:helix-turn-helix transcriptional regulator [Lentibacillus cibarius]
MGKHLQRYRLAKGLSQEELAYRAGLHAKYIGRIERGKHMPSFLTMHRLSQELAFPMDNIASIVESGINTSHNLTGAPAAAFQYFPPSTRSVPASGKSYSARLPEQQLPMDVSYYILEKQVERPGCARGRLGTGDVPSISACTIREMTGTSPVLTVLLPIQI